ncbi:hypothetical protein PLICRDRAFT_702660 [Plicaturopsis crispa FD-325 SS-3]|uniref:Uncharacterized protein n=1 Tax=Plicaturopsis crispa FD-325 SS-3 TaxID=944288 RepID=A0A0C9SV91_PLICR|nr:hypothetical protein PLICRDRAFT_702660 [Plicaturopsis crispa FD-325 SS-3]
MSRNCREISSFILLTHTKPPGHRTRQHHHASLRKAQRPPPTQTPPRTLYPANHDDHPAPARPTARCCGRQHTPPPHSAYHPKTPPFPLLRTYPTHCTHPPANDSFSTPFTRSPSQITTAKPPLPVSRNYTPPAHLRIPTTLGVIQHTPAPPISRRRPRRAAALGVLPVRPHRIASTRHQRTPTRRARQHPGALLHPWRRASDARRSRNDPGAALAHGHRRPQRTGGCRRPQAPAQLSRYGERRDGNGDDERRREQRQRQRRQRLALSPFTLPPPSRLPLSSTAPPYPLPTVASAVVFVPPCHHCSYSSLHK